MTTLQAIEKARNNKGEKVYFYALNNTYIYTNDGDHINLIIDGGHSLGFWGDASKHVEAVKADINRDLGLDKGTPLVWGRTSKVRKLQPAKMY